ncbi:MAG: hypothetical protein ABIS86_20495, partial [Streptosporangiaceae bacterium]
CAAAGIHVYVYTLFGYPGVPRRAEEDTAEYVRAETNIHTATIASFVPVAGSPFAVENAANLSHDGGMTEDFTTLRSSSGLEVPVGELGSDAARAALDRVLGHRRDLALTTLLNDEVRFALSSRFGADFAQRTGTAGRADIQGTAVEEAGHERIERALPLAPAERQAGALSFHHVLLYRAWDSRSWGRMSPMGNPGQSRGR